MWRLVISLLLIFYFLNIYGQTNEIDQSGGAVVKHRHCTGDDCPLRHRHRSDHRCKEFATSNGTLDWLVNHPAYYFKSYHGYFPWAKDDYAPFTPFDVNSPYFF